MLGLLCSFATLFISFVRNCAKTTDGLQAVIINLQYVTWSFVFFCFFSLCKLYVPPFAAPPHIRRVPHCVIAIIMPKLNFELLSQPFIPKYFVCILQTEAGGGLEVMLELLDRTQSDLADLQPHFCHVSASFHIRKLILNS